jgi:hypothetical protein
MRASPETQLEVGRVTSMWDKMLPACGVLPGSDLGHILDPLPAGPFPAGSPLHRSALCPFPSILACPPRL